MKKLTKLFAAIVLLSTLTFSAQAQAPKFGHINLQALVEVMPERTAAEKEFSNFQKELEDILTGMQKEYKQKISELEALGETASEMKKNAKISEIQEVQQRIQNYQVTAQQQLQKKQAELLKPVFEKAEKAVADVAKEKGLIYVFDIGTKVVLYKSNESLDVLPLAKAKLGIK